MTTAMDAKDGPGGRYHHGDLRAALIDAALELIEDEGADGLSLRACARHAGVSHAAPYRHFADKEALLTAVAEEGFRALRSAGWAAMEPVAGRRERLDAYGVAYVRFAVENRELFMLMFSRKHRVDCGPQPVPVGVAAFELLVDAVRPIVDREEDALETAVAAWTVPHGLAMLLLSGQLPGARSNGSTQVEALTRRVFELWRGPLGDPPSSDPAR
ncbi:MAG: TetR/AcrR family transcriptional regulator [Myxococcales bacterium FL481]|nr:MAG: TetR/AcrR family transcriptional regulator [Myxococcales bacterium FL481]